jgi:hypothetical protein
VYGIRAQTASQAEDAGEPRQHDPVLRHSLGQSRRSHSAWLARSLARTQARSRLQSELRAIAVDLLGRCQPDELPSDCAAWLAETVEAAVERVSDSSLSALVETLDSRLDSVSPRIARRLYQAEVRHDAGYV